MSVIPIAGINSEIITGGHSVIAIDPLPNGGIIVNPLLAADQGIVTAEVLYVDIVSSCGGSSLPSANGTVFALQPGQSWTALPGQSTATYVNANTTGHRFTVTSW